MTYQMESGYWTFAEAQSFQFWVSQEAAERAQFEMAELAALKEAGYEWVAVADEAVIEDEDYYEMIGPGYHYELMAVAA